MSVPVSSDSGWIRLTGTAGVATVVLFVIGIVLQSAAGPAPAYTDRALIAYIRNHSTLVITASLIIQAALVVELILVLGIRDLIRKAGGPWASIANLFLLAYVVAYPIGLVASGLVTAAATEAASTGDTSTVRTLWGAAYSLLGATSFLPLILATVTYAISVQRTRALPVWTDWIAWIAAIGAIAAIPSAFGGTGFYSQLGRAPALLQGIPGLAWVLAGFCEHHLGVAA